LPRAPAWATLIAMTTEPQPTEPQPQEPPRRLTRSTTDRMIGGVAGGLGRHLNIDPLAVRIGFVILSFAGGIGIIGYLLGLVFVPSDDPDAEPVRWGLARTVGAGLVAVAAFALLTPNWLWGPGVPLLVIAAAVIFLLVRVTREDGGNQAAHVAARIALGIVLVALAVGGFIAAAAGSALGGGIIVAGLVIACGVGLVGGAFRGGARWLAVPALVLAVPLGAVAATDLDVRGTWGDRTFRPASVAELARGYDMGAGSMKIDLRDVDFPVGDTELRADLGLGEVQLLVPADLCVTTDATVGVGAVNTGDGEQGGVDLDIRDDRPVDPGVAHLHVIADVGMGHVQVGDSFFDFVGPPGWRDDGFEDLRSGSNPRACRGAA
jgi:phage shock protein PspC (stress-responsive transcriptional regulator)